MNNETENTAPATEAAAPAQAQQPAQGGRDFRGPRGPRRDGQNGRGPRGPRRDGRRGPQAEAPVEEGPQLAEKLNSALGGLLFGKNESAAEPEAAVSNQKK